MKADEAIQILKTWRITGDESHEALDMAIDALAKDINVPINDCISRHEAIEAIEHITSSMSVCVNTDECHGMKRMQRQAVKELANLPSAEPETAKRIVGKSRDGMTMWYQCDMCNEPVDEKDTFCSGCGRRLVNG